MIDKLLFLDIETASGYKSIELLSDKSPDLASAWYKKAIKKYGNEYTNSDTNPIDFSRQSYIEKSALYPEFGRVVSVTMGMINITSANGDQEPVLQKKNLKSFYNEDEATLLKEVANALNKASSNIPDSILAGFNIKKFDMPYLCKRMVINRIPIPSIIDVTGKKPYEIKAVDLMERWMFGSYEWISLEVVALALGLGSPKGKMSGEEVTQVFYSDELTPEQKKSTITEYCASDVMCVMDVAMILL
jgi:3'-5' exonuclease